jgi:signal transduction histidine kinase
MNQSLLPPHNVAGVAGCGCEAFLTAASCTHSRFRPLAFARFEQALSALGDELLLSAGTRYRILVTGRPQVLDTRIQEQLYEIAREALRNTLRHSAATSVEAEIEYLPDKVRVAIRDNGCGMNAHVLLRGAHQGLLTMRERAAKIGGALRVWSRPGAGTEVEICVSSHVV